MSGDADGSQAVTSNPVSGATAVAVSGEDTNIIIVTTAGGVTVRSMTVNTSREDLAAVTYKNGKNTVYSYDTDGNIISITKDGVLTQSYEYDKDGYRSAKTVNGVRTEYKWLGSTLLMEKTEEDTIWYLHDGSGELLGFELNGYPITMRRTFRETSPESMMEPELR